MEEVLVALGRSSGNLNLAKEQANQFAEDLDHSDAGVRSSSALSLGRLGAAAVPHIGRLRRRLDDSDSFVRAAASVALGQIPGGSEKPKTPKVQRRRTGTSKSSVRPTAVGRAQARPASAGSSGRARPASASSSGRLRPASAGGAGQARPTASGSGRPARPFSAGSTRQPPGTTLPGSRSRSNRPFRTGLAHSSPFREYTGISYTVRCHCGLAVQRRESQSCRQKGRFYFGCPQEQGGCNFKVWEKD